MRLIVRSHSCFAISKIVSMAATFGVTLLIVSCTVQLILAPLRYCFLAYQKCGIIQNENSTDLNINVEHRIDTEYPLLDSNACRPAAALDSIRAYSVSKSKFQHLHSSQCSVSYFLDLNSKEKRPITANCLRLYNADAVQTGNQLSQTHRNSNRGNARSKHNDPAFKECKFALKLYRQLSAAGEGNILFSPLSVVTTISALMEGANGTTARELLTTLNRTANEGLQYRTRISDVMGKLSQKKTGSSEASYVLTAANRIYIHQDYHLLPPFLKTLQRSYKMEAIRLDFGKPHAESSINDWVSQATYNKINSLVPEGTLGMQTRLLLANVIYFKGDWQTMFPEANTRLRPFHYMKDSYVQVPMMSVEAEFRYCDYTKMGFEMIELPYVGGDVSMFVVLPYESQNLNTIARRLQQRPLMLSKPGRKMYSSLITVMLPKFNLEESVDLKEALVGMGVKQVFEQGKADLSGMSDTRELYVSDALHKAAVEVNEKGTRAAAATAIVIKGRSMNSDPVFRADRPFMYFIRHNPTESILFLGNVKQLKDASP